MKDQSLEMLHRHPASLRPVPSLQFHCSMGEAARQMYMSGSEALIVLDQHGRGTLGVITARDIVALVAEGLDPESVTIEQRLQSPRCIDSNRPLTDVWFS